MQAKLLPHLNKKIFFVMHCTIISTVYRIH